MKTGEKFERLVQIMERLRGECPWDRRQDHASLRQYLLEETHEALHALDAGDYDELRDELGDLLLQIVFHSAIAREDGRFDIGAVIDRVNEKLVRRHPHVFADAEADSPRQVEARWERIKRAEKEGRSRLGDIPRELPALQKAYRVLQKMDSAGSDPFAGCEPGEAAEQALADLTAAAADGAAGEAEGALAELLMAVARLALSAGINPEDALRARVSEVAAAFRSEEREQETAPPGEQTRAS